MTATSRAHPAASLSSTHPSISPSTHSSISPSASWLCPGLCLLSERCGAVRAELACCCRLTRVSSSGVLTSCLFLWRHFCVCCRLRGVRGSSVDTMWPCKQYNFHGFSPKCQKYIWRCLIWSFVRQKNTKFDNFLSHFWKLILSYATFKQENKNLWILPSSQHKKFKLWHILCQKNMKYFTSHAKNKTVRPYSIKKNTPKIRQK